MEMCGCEEKVKEAFTCKTMDKPKFLGLMEAIQEENRLVVCKCYRFVRTTIERGYVKGQFERDNRVRISNTDCV